ncbi:MAG: NIPSNAP family protein [Verrucomicrobia bacterium]|nr:NIPSNAP family protein [Verrucomicrobiota bacterium]
MLKPVYLCSSILTLVCSLSLTPSAPAAGDKPCYELRTYYAVPGKLDALHARFRDHTCKLFEKHGIQNLGYWVPLDNSENKLIYLLAHPSREAAKTSWKEFMADPDWQAAYKASEANGKLVNKVESVFTQATDYSPTEDQNSGSEPRVFELRTYKAAPGKLNDLHARFRDHTCKLFEKHGIQNIGYGVPMDKDKGADDTLIYLIAHKSKAAAAESWKAFASDPDWKKAKAESEAKAGGPLTVEGGVKSVYLKATDYSPIK